MKKNNKFALISFALIFILIITSLTSCRIKYDASEIVSSSQVSAEMSNKDDSLDDTSIDADVSNTISDSYQSAADATSIFDADEVPVFSDKPYVKLNNNVPAFSKSDHTTVSFERYSELDELGRCGVAYACIGKDLMPTEDREGIGQVKPSGWHTIKYDFVDGKYLYNRCHLIGFQLTAENANKKNLITGTRYMNVQGMLPFENMVADYIKETDNHVLYRVTPVYEGDNLVASGVQLEAYSVEDAGEGVSFNVYVYNAQPGVIIDYSTGDSHAVGVETESTMAEQAYYILNKSSKKIHLPDCEYANSIKESNKKEYIGTRSELISQGYEPCKSCNP